MKCGKVESPDETMMIDMIESLKRMKLYGMHLDNAIVSEVFIPGAVGGNRNTEFRYYKRSYGSLQTNVSQLFVFLEAFCLIVDISVD
jgi:hypothetical protein